MPVEKMHDKGLILGIDVGSVSISLVSMDLEGKIVDQSYELHQGNIRAAVHKLMHAYLNPVHEDRLAKIAAHLLEASEEDIRFENGAAHVAGSPDKSVDWSEIATAAYQPHLLAAGMTGGLEAHVAAVPRHAHAEGLRLGLQRQKAIKAPELAQHLPQQTIIGRER